MMTLVGTFFLWLKTSFQEALLSYYPLPPSPSVPRKCFYAESTQGKCASPQEVPFKVDMVLEGAVPRRALWEIKVGGFMRKGYSPSIFHHEWKRGDFHVCALLVLIVPLTPSLCRETKHTESRKTNELPLPTVTDESHRWMNHHTQKDYGL